MASARCSTCAGVERIGPCGLHRPVCPGGVLAHFCGICLDTGRHPTGLWGRLPQGGVEVNSTPKFPAGRSRKSGTSINSTMKLVNPANKRKFEVIVVGSGRRGIWASRLLQRNNTSHNSWTYHIPQVHPKLTSTPRSDHSTPAIGAATQDEKQKKHENVPAKRQEQNHHRKNLVASWASPHSKKSARAVDAAGCTRSAGGKWQTPK